MKDDSGNTGDRINLRLFEKVQEAVDMITKAQWADGYINSYFTVGYLISL